MNRQPIWLGAALMAFTAAGSWSQSRAPAVVLEQPLRHTGTAVDVNLHAADGETISRTLGDALGATVRVEALGRPTLTLDLQGTSARAALDAVARALYGEWRPVYTVTSGSPSATAQHPLPLGRTITANLEQVGARSALLLVARAGGGTVDLPADLPQSVRLVAREMPVEQALDELTHQVGGRWSVTYVIKAGAAPPPVSQPPPTGNLPPNSGQRRPGTGVPSGLQLQGTRSDSPFPNRGSFPVPPGAGTPEPGRIPNGFDPNAANLIGEGLTRVMQMPGAQRQLALKDFATQLEQQFRQIQLLPPGRRAEQMAAMRPIFQAATRTAKGLTPGQRAEFQPILDVFTRWLR